MFFCVQIKKRIHSRFIHFKIFWTENILDIQNPFFPLPKLCCNHRFYIKRWILGPLTLPHLCRPLVVECNQHPRCCKQPSPPLKSWSRNKNTFYILINNLPHQFTKQRSKLCSMLVSFPLHIHQQKQWMHIPAEAFFKGQTMKGWTHRKGRSHFSGRMTGSFLMKHQFGWTLRSR